MGHADSRLFCLSGRCNFDWCSFPYVTRANIELSSLKHSEVGRGWRESLGGEGVGASTLGIIRTMEMGRTDPCKPENRGHPPCVTQIKERIG